MTLIPTIRQVWDLVSGYSVLGLVGVGGFSILKIVFSLPQKKDVPDEGLVGPVLKFNRSRGRVLFFVILSVFITTVLVLSQQLISPLVPAKGHIPHHLNPFIIGILVLQVLLYGFFILATYYSSEAERLYKKL